MARQKEMASTGIKVRKSANDKVFDFFLYLLAAIIIIIVLYPMYFIVIASISNPADVSAGNIVLLPKGINFKGYMKLGEYTQLWVGYKNTILYTLLGTVLSLVVNIPAAYALSRKELCGKKLFTIYYLIPMFFTGGLIPTYLVVKDFNLLDNFWVMVVPFSVITYYIIVARTFFNNSIPDDLWEAVIAVIALWTAVGQWNSYFNALIYLRSPELQPLQLVLRNILISNQKISAMTTGAAAVEAKQMADLIKYAIIVISSAPIMCMYPFVQKYFNQGVMLGSLKG